MIDEYCTWILFGYHSDELSKGSNKRVVAVCEDCYLYRDVAWKDYRDLCLPCSNKSEYVTDEHRRKIGKSSKGRIPGSEAREKMSEAQKGRHHTEESKRKMSESAKKRAPVSEETRLKMSISCKKRLENPENNPSWRGGISIGKYCHEFNDEIRQCTRDKYNNCDYISGLPDHVCNSRRKLDVHHVDYNKEQGCDEHDWQLIPLSQSNHLRTNFRRSFWNRLFTYSLQYDEEYYKEEDKEFDIFDDNKCTLIPFLS
jgi:hypothetical protein